MKKPSPEQAERAKAAAAKRTEDPLKNWTPPPRDDCPICLVPLPFSETLPQAETSYWSCCGKSICKACIYKRTVVNINSALKKTGGRKLNEKEEAECLKITQVCPFCRNNESCDGYSDEAVLLAQDMKLAEAGRPRAIWRVGGYHFDGKMGFTQDKVEGIKWFRRAAEAGSSGAANALGLCYLNGDGVEKRDVMQALGWFQRSSELGRVQAFAMIGALLYAIGDIEESMLNYRMAAICGFDVDGVGGPDAPLRNGFRDGFITKEEYAYTLRAYQAASNEVKSEERDAHREMRRRGEL